MSDNNTNNETQTPSIDEVKAMLHEIAYVLHVTKKIKREILEDAVREHSEPITGSEGFVGRGPKMNFRPEFTAGA